MPSALWLAYADQNPVYAGWLERVDDLCDRLLDVRFSDLANEGILDPSDAFHRHQMRADRFVAECVIPYLQSEHGSEMIFDSIGENVLWGSCNPVEEP